MQIEEFIGATFLPLAIIVAGSVLAWLVLLFVLGVLAKLFITGRG